MTRQRKVISGEFEDVVTQSGNGGHVILPRNWIGKIVSVKIKEVKQ
jgi:putative transposon-encoded protein